MISTLIIEDERPAALRLEKLLKDAESTIEILGILDSVELAVKWLKSNPHPDLLVLDIQLADGLSFDIFNQVTVESFVIFTTAYDEYAIKAFELNSIDYLLKPVDKDKLQHSLSKYKKLKPGSMSFNLNSLIEQMESRSTQYKKRFAISLGTKIVSVEAADIDLFYSLEKNTFLVAADGRNYPLDFSLDRLENLVNPKEFFRVSRQYMVRYGAIEKIHVLSKSRIELQFKSYPERVLVSTPKTSSFRQWIDK